jgi:S1-C subfamily serine protease
VESEESTQPERHEDGSGAPLEPTPAALRIPAPSSFERGAFGHAPWPSVPVPPRTPSAETSANAKAPRAWGRTIGLLALVLVIALGAGTLGGWIASKTHTPSLTINQSTAAPGGAVLPSGLTIPALVKRVLPAVVSIDVKSGGNEDQGTGMIITSSGLVVTNNHVIALASIRGSITITRSGSTAAQTATLVGTIPSEDVALLQIVGASSLPTVTIGDSNKAQVGDAVVAIGNALGLAAGTPSVTQGIVSALGRTVTAGDSTSTATETLTNMIQTDAAINPGNSGGPLLDAAGDVIGMNTAVAGSTSSGSSAQNIGFAIPSNTIEQLLAQLEKGGSGAQTPTGGYLGVEITTLTPDLRSQYKLTPASGVVVLSVVAGGPASKAGLLQGDVIVAVNGTQVSSAVQLTQVIKSATPGSTLKLGIYRGARQETLVVKVGSSATG